jgi:hypothetical protein
LSDENVESAEVVRETHKVMILRLLTTNQTSLARLKISSGKKRNTPAVAHGHGRRDRD